MHQHAPPLILARARRWKSALFAVLVLLGCSARPSSDAPVTAAHPAAATTTAMATATVSPTPTASASASPLEAPSASAAAEPPPPPANPLPEGFVPGPTSPGEHTKCGSLELFSIEEPGDHIPFVRVLDEAGKKIYEAHGRRMQVDKNVFTHEWLSMPWCGDLTGDGVPEIMLSESSMGAHCCYTYYLVSMTRPAKTLLMWEKGDGGFDMLPEKLRQGKAWQVTSMHLVWPPFDAEKGDPVIAGYAGAPFYPIVFDFVGGEYVKRTLSFKSYLRDRRKQMREQCAKDQSCDALVFHDWGYSLMIGDWDKERAAIAEGDLLKSLDKQAAKMTSLLASELGR
jgi:hypothetical protein